MCTLFCCICLKSLPNIRRPVFIKQTYYISYQKNEHIDRQTNIQTNTQTDLEKQTNTLTNIQTNIDRQTHKHTHKHTTVLWYLPLSKSRQSSSDHNVISMKTKIIFMLKMTKNCMLAIMIILL